MLTEEREQCKRQLLFSRPKRREPILVKVFAVREAFEEVDMLHSHFWLWVYVLDWQEHVMCVRIASYTGPC